MGSLSKRDIGRLRLLEQWCDIATEALYDIEGWRGATGERYQYAGDKSREWGEMPNGFYTATASLIQAITLEYPKLDSAPLQEIYSVVYSWYNEHSAAHIKPQVELILTFDRAMMALEVLRGDVMRKQERPLEPSKDLVTANDIAERISLETRSLERYRKHWPAPDVPAKGRSPARWSYRNLLSMLKQQFPDEKWPDSWPKRPVR